jgi:hypothetical protein
LRGKESRAGGSEPGASQWNWMRGNGNAGLVKKDVVHEKQLKKEKQQT